MASVLELMSVLSLSYWQLQPLTLAVSQAAAPQPNTVGISHYIIITSSLHHHFYDMKECPTMHSSDVIGC